MQRLKKTVFFFTFLLAMILSVHISAQISSKKVKAENSKAILLGKSKSIKELISLDRRSKKSKNNFKEQRQRPDNFKYRRGNSKVIRPDLEHQGPDPIRQKGFKKSLNNIQPLVNVDGLFSDFGSPHDPSGEIGQDYFVQAINATEIGIYDKEGQQVERFFASILWSEFGVQSAGDPIVLYDETVARWIITEFTGPANMLVAISETSNPLGSFYAYNFSTPEFPDYPKYSIWPNSYVVTTNEGGAGVLHQYFIDRQAMLDGLEEVSLQRVEVMGNTNTEAGFFVSTPVDWNGIKPPTDSKPMVVVLNDSSWGATPNDAVEIYSFDVDFETPDSTKVFNTSIVTTPYDSYPCSVIGQPGFDCFPQPGTIRGLDGIPEIIMNLPHYRNFDTHESIVFNFITDVTDGNNLSGIRWMELRKTPDQDWSLYQEGTFAPDDGLNRYMGSMAIDKNGNIGLAYNVSNEETFVGIRFTGRYDSDPLGEMSVEEYTLVDGLEKIESFGRFGDYAHMSIDPTNGSTFWYTTEYAGPTNSRTRIAAFELTRDTFDLDVAKIVSPSSSDMLTASELMTIDFKNTGLQDISNFNVGFSVDGIEIENAPIFETLKSDSTYRHEFSQFIDFSAERDYEIVAYISDDLDQNFFNDTLKQTITHYPALAASISGENPPRLCDNDFSIDVDLNNLGTSLLTSATIEIRIDGRLFETTTWQGRIQFGKTETINLELIELDPGDHVIDLKLINVNDTPNPVDESNLLTLMLKVVDPENQVEITLFTDDFPAETKWNLLTIPSGEIIASGGPYFDQNVRFNELVCLEQDSCYTFEIFDSQGDGICCDFGTGFYEITDIDGVSLLFSEGRFGEMEANNFCLGVSCNIDAEVEITDASGPQAFDGAILITATNGIEPYSYSIDNGRNFQESPLFENLDDKPYFIVVRSRDNVCEFTDVVILRVNTSTATSEITEQNSEIIVTPNPTNGIFQIEITQSDINELYLTTQIFNAAGHLLQERKMPKYGNSYQSEFSLVSASAGNYYVRFKHPKINQLVKLIKL